LRAKGGVAFSFRALIGSRFYAQRRQCRICKRRDAVKFTEFDAKGKHIGKSA